MTGSFDVRIGKSEAEITNNKRLRSKHCTVEATERHKASRGLSATAGLLVWQGTALSFVFITMGIYR